MKYINIDKIKKTLSEENSFFYYNSFSSKSFGILLYSKLTSIFGIICFLQNFLICTTFILIFNFVVFYLIWFPLHELNVIYKKLLYFNISFKYIVTYCFFYNFNILVLVFSYLFLNLKIFGVYFPEHSLTLNPFDNMIDLVSISFDLFFSYCLITKAVVMIDIFADKIKFTIHK